MRDEFNDTVWKLFTSTGQIGYYMFLSDLMREAEAEELRNSME